MFCSVSPFLCFFLFYPFLFLFSFLSLFFFLNQKQQKEFFRNKLVGWQKKLEALRKQFETAAKRGKFPNKAALQEAEGMVTEMRRDCKVWKKAKPQVLPD